MLPSNPYFPEDGLQSLKKRYNDGFAVVYGWIESDLQQSKSIQRLRRPDPSWDGVCCATELL